MWSEAGGAGGRGYRAAGRGGSGGGARTELGIIIRDARRKEAVQLGGVQESLDRVRGLWWPGAGPALWIEFSESGILCRIARCGTGPSRGQNRLRAGNRIFVGGVTTREVASPGERVIEATPFQMLGRVVSGALGRKRQAGPPRAGGRDMFAKRAEWASSRTIQEETVGRLLISAVGRRGLRNGWRNQSEATDRGTGRVGGGT